MHLWVINSKQKIMKTKIQNVLAVVIVTLCLTNLSAQHGTPVAAVVEKSFNKEFNDVTFVNWSKVNNLFLARFEDQKENCIAYFAPDGQMLLSGREIPYSIAPRTVKKETERIKTGSPKKRGFLEVGKIYEVNDSGETMYYVNLNGPVSRLSVMVHGNGHSEILQENPLTSREDKAMIASKAKK